MAQERPNRFSEWLLMARQHAPVLRQQLAEWVQACAAEPRLIWETTAIRYATYLIGGLILVKIVSASVSAFTPALPPSARDLATTADFHVLCSDPNCGAHFVVHRAFGFDDFPVECPRCRKETGYQAMPCASAKCHGAWRTPVAKGGRLECPICGSPMGAP